MKKTIFSLFLFSLSFASGATTYAEAVSNYDKAFNKAKLNAALWNAEIALEAGDTRPKVGNLAISGTGVNNVSLVGKLKGTAGGSPLTIDVQSKFVPDKVQSSLVKFMKKSVPFLSTGYALYDLVKEIDGWDVSNDPVGGVPQFTKTTVGDSCVSNCYEYKMDAPQTPTIYHKTKSAACIAWVAATPAAGYTKTFTQVLANPTKCEYRLQSLDGSYSQLWNSGAIAMLQRLIPPWSDATTTPKTPDEFVGELTAAQKTINNLSRLLRDAIESGEAPDVEPAPTITAGPSSTPGPETVTTGTSPTGEPTTTTTTTTNHFNYSGDTITHSTTNVTNTCVGTAACTTSTTTTTNAPPKSDETITTSDTPFGAIPQLYTPKYPNGLTGVWAARKAELTSTPLVSLVDVILPPMPETGGTCPTWPLDLSLASFAQFGSWDVAPPCWIWDFGKVIVIISALLLARRLVFGG